MTVMPAPMDSRADTDARTRLVATVALFTDDAVMTLPRDDPRRVMYRHLTRHLRRHRSVIEQDTVTDTGRPSPLHQYVTVLRATGRLRHQIEAGPELEPEPLHPMVTALFHALLTDPDQQHLPRPCTRRTPAPKPADRITTNTGPNAPPNRPRITTENHGRT